MIKKEIYDMALEIRLQKYKQFGALDIAVFYAIAELKDQLNEIRKEIKMAKKKASKKVAAKKTATKKNK